MKYLRLKKQADFERLFHKGKRAFSPSLTVLYFTTKLDKNVMGISIGKRHGKSVKRNRIKRLLREAFRTVEKDIKGKYSIVLLPKVSEEYSYQTYVQHLKWIIKKEKM
jgi:ribonuclease P protein component